MCLLASFTLEGVVKNTNFYNDVWFSNAELVREVRVGLKASLEDQQMGNPCVSGGEELTTAMPGWALVGTDQCQHL